MLNSGGYLIRSSPKPSLGANLRYDKIPANRAGPAMIVGSLIPKPPKEMGNWELSQVDSSTLPMPKISESALLSAEVAMVRVGSEPVVSDERRMNIRLDACKDLVSIACCQAGWPSCPMR